MEPVEPQSPEGACVELVAWDEWHERLAAVRREVFVEEQAVPESLEMDGQDPACLHAAVIVAGRVVGTGRLLPGGQIGRMAILGPWRRRGLGGRLLARLVEAATNLGHFELTLNAQVQVVPFYLRHGFDVVGGEFTEAGIVHVPMRKTVDRETKSGYR